MATFTKFEEIVAWQKARSASAKIYTLTAETEFGRDFALRDQIRRSAISIMANIAEGHGRTSNKEFANFLNFARGSAMETQSHLYMALDLGYVVRGTFDEIYSLLDEISRMIMGLMKHLRGT